MINTITYRNGPMLGALITILSVTRLFFPVFSKAGSGASDTLRMEGELSSLSDAGAWFNSKPLTGADLKGKVVLIEFCTYTCINWLRTLPYMRAWAEKYKDKGLVLIAVHTPEFPFEKNIDNVQRAIRDLKIDFPIAIDNNYSIWNAFNNQYWPAIYLADIQGRIRHHQFGEGGFELTEKAIQELLAEAGSKDTHEVPVSVNGDGIEAAADWSNLESRENYLGFERTENFSSPGGQKRRKQATYRQPANLRLNHWAISGNWTIDQQSILLNTPNGTIVYRFHARDLHLIMGPSSAGTLVRFRVLLDGKPPGASHGKDIDEQGNGLVTEHRLYQLLRQSMPVIDREVTIEFMDQGAVVFAFTFG